MSRIGYALIGLALLLGIGAAGFQRAYGGALPDAAALAFGAAVLVGMALLLISAVNRLMKGEVRLRPADAAKRGILVFCIILGLRFLAFALFPDWAGDPIEAILSAACFATAYSLYTTAYRKPA